LIKTLSTFLFVILSLVSFSQGKADKKHLYTISKEAFDFEEFDQALVLLLRYDSLYPGDGEVKYRIGACYLNTEFEVTKAIPYLEYAKKEFGDQYPASALLDLAHIYHLNYQFDKSEEMYRKYLKIRPSAKEEVLFNLEIIEKAKALVKDSLTVRIENIGEPVNTNESEISPYVSADESILYYQKRENRDLYFANYKYDRWSKKVKIDIPNLNDYEIVRFAGISPDGEEIYLQLGDSVNTDLYHGRNILKTCNQLIPFNENINSPYREENLSIEPDNNTLYFSSNRPGGYGGFDIYKSVKNENGEWGVAENLGPVINSKKDELAPFIHPSGKRLFFSSNGHETMGGFDILEGILVSGKWEFVRNIGYPVNTTFDEMSYSMTAKGNAAYFSSTRNNLTHHFDIYKVYLKENIPLTLVKGRILAGDPPVPVRTEIKVIDKLTQKPLKYIYNPNPKTGNYLLVFPPGKDYDMIINAEGYQPYIVNIYLPNQSYFYENFQEILLRPIKVNSIGETVGEEIKITNTFYDIYQNVHEYDTVRNEKYDKLLNIINDLIEETDTLGLNAITNYAETIEEVTTSTDSVKLNKDYSKLFSLIEEAIETTDSIALQVLDENSISNYSYQNNFFYDRDEQSTELIEINLNEDKSSTLKLKSDDNEITQKEESVSSKVKKPIKEITECSVYFDKNSSEITSNYKERLIEIATLVRENKTLYIEIKGYANKSEKDKQLAVARAIELRSVLVSENLNIRKTKTSAFLNNTEDNKEGRRVDVRIFESEEMLYSNGRFTAAVRLSDLNETANVNSEGQVFYRIQLAAGPNKLSIKDPSFKHEKVDLYRHNDLYKYVLGNFTNVIEARKETERLISKGFKDAFIVRFKNGQRID